MIVIMAGLPGTGKTTLARELARLCSGAVVSKDEIRAALFSPPDIEFSTAQDDFCMEIMLQAAHLLVMKHPERRIFLDGRTFSRQYQVDRVLNFAAELGQRAVILECVCSDESARRRLDEEPDPGHPAGNRTYALYLGVKARFEPIREPKTVIDTDHPQEDCVQRASGALD